ncbi:spore germination protein [Neobacillus sp. NPDC097160]|uniref:spore germination protein n=1 Tax=Neobacillus sp. NPDC097160 TaxID=3364298 RepID=UPI003802A6EC
MEYIRKWWLRKLLGNPNQHSQTANLNGQKKKILHNQLEANVDWIVRKFGNSTDLVVRKFEIGERETQHAAILYIDGISDSKSVLESFLKLLNEHTYLQILNTPFDVEKFMNRLVVPVGSVKKESDLDLLLTAIVSGDTVILFQGLEQAFVASTRQWKERSIEEPISEPVVRGPRDGFTETLRTNTSLLRKRIKNPNLWMETLQIGRATKTDVAIMYIRDIANPKIVDEVLNRLKAIDIDSILESGYIQEMITDRTITVFPLIYNSERPDVISAEILEGRVAILVDGTPTALIAPAVFVQFLQASEDYYQNWDFATFIRMVRYGSLGITLLAPALYIAITNYHQEILPPKLLLSLAAAREGVPFPAFIEATMMELIFELLREASVRMPRTVGSAISIVGTLVIGQSAVQAGLVSPAMVIIVSLTAISNFAIPSYSMSTSFRMLRFFIMWLAASLGIFGILLGLFIIVFHLCSLQSFGLPYMSAFAPFHIKDQKDVILRVPRWLMVTRPHFNKNRNYIRVDSNMEAAKANKKSSMKNEQDPK